MTELQEIAIGVAYVALALVALVIGKAARGLLSSHCLDDELTKNDNPAQGVALVGYYAGVLIIFLGATTGETIDLPTNELLAQIGIDLLWVIAGVIGLNIGRFTVDKLLLRKFSVKKEIVEDRNVGTGAVVAGAYLATAFVMAGALSGEGGGPLTALVFFLLGQLVLVLFTAFYQLVSPYDVHDEIERDNAAAGLALGGNLAAIGIILFGATRIDVVEGLPETGVAATIDWAAMLEKFGYYALLGFPLLLVLRWASDLVLLPKSTMKEEIVQDRNLNAAWIETTVVTGMASVIIFMI